MNFTYLKDHCRLKWNLLQTKKWTNTDFYFFFCNIEAFTHPSLVKKPSKIMSMPIMLMNSNGKVEGGTLKDGMHITTKLSSQLKTACMKIKRVKTNLCPWEHCFPTFRYISKIHEYSCYAVPTPGNVDLVNKIIIMGFVFLTRFISQNLYVFSVLWKPMKTSHMWPKKTKELSMDFHQISNLLFKHMYKTIGWVQNSIVCNLYLSYLCVTPPY